MMFSGLPEDAFDHTLQPIDHFIFPAGAVLYEAGSSRNFIFSIRCGLVKLLNVAPDGTQRIVRILGPGSSVGLELLDHRDRYHHTAVAVNELDACRIPMATVRALQEEYPQLSHQVRERLQDHLDKADRWITALGTGPARERISNLLLFLTEISADANGDIELLGRDDMAAVVGTTVETVSRIIAELKRRGVLFKVTATRYRCDLEALRAAAEQRKPGSD